MYDGKTQRNLSDLQGILFTTNATTETHKHKYFFN